MIALKCSPQSQTLPLPTSRRVAVSDSSQGLQVTGKGLQSRVSHDQGMQAHSIKDMSDRLAACGLPSSSWVTQLTKQIHVHAEFLANRSSGL
jgi:hypothetical protein